MDKKLFDVVPAELFSVLASPNKKLYAEALDMVYIAYQEHLKIEENVLYAMIRNRLGNELEVADFADEDIDVEELADISGRARFLIRKLVKKGWIEKERGSNFEEYIIVPNYSSRLLELFHELTDDKTLRGYSYVFGTYSTLKVAMENQSAYDKMVAVYNAYENTTALVKMLKDVYHNIRRFCQLQAEMYEVNEILATHFDDFGQNVMESYVKPLKIKDSVPKYRNAIQNALKMFMEDAELELLANAAYMDKRFKSLQECKLDLLHKISAVNDIYDNIEADYLDEIDKQVRRYTRATTRKLENITSRDQNLRGNLNYLLTRLATTRKANNLVEQIQPIFNIYDQSYIEQQSLWQRKRPVRRAALQSLDVEDFAISAENRKQLENMLQFKYSKKAVAEYMDKLLENKKAFYSRDWPLDDDYAYIMSLLAVINSTDRQSCYRVEALDGNFTQGDYTIPQLKITRKDRV